LALVDSEYIDLNRAWYFSLSQVYPYKKYVNNYSKRKYETCAYVMLRQVQVRVGLLDIWLPPHLFKYILHIQATTTRKKTTLINEMTQVKNKIDRQTD